MKLEREILPVCAAAILSGHAIAQNAATDFESIDTDQSGTLSLPELQMVMPDVTIADVVQFDTDASGDLSPDEFTNWLASATKN